MRIFSWLFSDFINSIKHNGNLDEIIYKVPIDGRDIVYNCKVKIANGYTLIVYLNSEIYDIIDNGEYMLNIDTLPNIAKELNWHSGNDGVFNADVYYINLNSFKLNLLNKAPFLIKDLKNNIIKLTIEGTIEITISEVNKFLRHILKKGVKLSKKRIVKYLERLSIAILPDIIANRSVPLSYLLQSKSELNKFLVNSCNNRIDEIGLFATSVDVKKRVFSIEKKGRESISSTKDENIKKYYIIKKAQVDGAYSKKEISNLLDNLELKPNSYIWREGLKDWIKIIDLVDFE